MNFIFKVKYFKLIFGLAICFIVFFAFFPNSKFPIPNSYAASYFVYFSAPAEVPPGAAFPVKVLVDSDQPLNAYDANLNYSGLEIVGFNNSRSIIDVWQNQPIIYGGEVKFNGGSLTPFQGTGGELMTINFRAAATGTAELSFGSATFYLANGKGTKVAPQEKSFSIIIAPAAAGSSPAAGLSGTPTSADDTPPAIKFLSIVPDPINSHQKLVSFLTSDSGSGIKSVSLRTRSYFFWNDWLAAENPTAIPLSVWAVGFKAADNAGNIAEKIIYDWPAFWRFALMILAAAAGIIALLILLIKKGRRQKHNANEVNFKND